MQANAQKAFKAFGRKRRKFEKKQTKKQSGEGKKESQKFLSRCTQKILIINHL